MFWAGLRMVIDRSALVFVISIVGRAMKVFSRSSDRFSPDAALNVICRYASMFVSGAPSFGFSFSSKRPMSLPSPSAVIVSCAFALDMVMSPLS